MITSVKVVAGRTLQLLECVINISEGTDLAVLKNLRNACSTALLDVHSDMHHNRSVFTLGGVNVEDAARSLTMAAVHLLDLTDHEGVHPRFGVVDVVPFTPMPGSHVSIEDAHQAQLAYAEWAALELGIPTFLYGTHRSLPQLRKSAFVDLKPDFGGPDPHATAGAIAVGARPALIAYNLWLDKDIDFHRVKTIARETRSANLRTLALEVGTLRQVSCNLIEPMSLGPAEAYDCVAKYVPVHHAELVGLIPRAVLETQPEERWNQLDLCIERTVEHRLNQLPG